MNTARALPASSARRDSYDRTSIAVRCSTSIWSSSGPSKDCGDYAESFTLPSALLAIGVWDASGKGEAAAENMVLVRAALRAMLNVNGDLPATLLALNRVLVRQVECSTGSWPFVSGFFGTIDKAQRTLNYVSCGHDAAILFRKSGSHVHLDHNGPLLGVDERHGFAEKRISIERGDALVIATDGITEARPLNSQKKWFGTKRICSLFSPRRAEHSANAEWLIAQAISFADGWLDDDAAVLIARIT